MREELTFARHVNLRVTNTNFIMHIHKLKLTNYRNHLDFEYDFKGNSATLVGPNAIGKTNILEAINLLSTTKALRAKYDKELINYNKNFARVDSTVDVNGEKIALEVAIARTPDTENVTKKLVKINKVNKSLGKFVGTFNSVLFTPADIQILTGSPTLRRQYLNSILFQIDSKYKKDFSEYTKAIRQRNKILEKIAETSKGRDELTFWTEKVLVLGVDIQETRKNMFGEFKEHLYNIMYLLNDNKNQYELNYLINEISEERLEKYRQKELWTKTTLVGPHRDDFEIRLNGHDIAYYGSRGQQRTTILGLKMCETEYISEKVGTRPVLLLDDIFSELDPKHTEAVNEIIKQQQTIITTAIEAKDTLQIN